MEKCGKILEYHGNNPWQMWCWPGQLRLPMHFLSCLNFMRTHHKFKVKC